MNENRSFSVILELHLLFPKISFTEVSISKIDKLELHKSKAMNISGYKK